jgi:hypothetical protein
MAVLVDPVLDAQAAVLEGDLAVLDEVRRPPGLEEVLDQGAAPPQVEAERRGGQRRDQQDRVALLTRGGRGPVVVDLPELALVDQGARHRPEVGQPAVQHLVRQVAGRGHDLIGLRDQIHARTVARSQVDGAVSAD